MGHASHLLLLAGVKTDPHYSYEKLGDLSNLVNNLIRRKKYYFHGE